MPRNLFRRPPERTYRQPRVTVLYVIRRTVMRLLDLQVWDVAASMTYYTLLSMLPAAVALVSMVSLLGLGEETVFAAAELVHELVPDINPQAAAAALLALSNTSGGVLGVVLGLVGVVLSASQAVASFHRAMHRIHDTREGRPFLWFRTIVFFETLLLMLGMIATMTLVVIGGDLSERLGQVLGLTQEAVATWNTLKWPGILIILVITVSVAYYRGPNVKLPHFRIMTPGGVFTVLLLFSATVLLGRLAEALGALDRVIGTLNGAIVVMVITWLGFIVLLAGAAFDAELLRARQLAAGLPSWDVLQLRTRHTGVLEFLEGRSAAARSTAWNVAQAARAAQTDDDTEPLTGPRTPWLAEEGSFLAVDAPDRDVSTGTPYYAEQLEAMENPDRDHRHPLP